jgi:hypothetical protein
MRTQFPAQRYAHFRRIVAAALGAVALTLTGGLAAAPAWADEPQSCWTDIDTGAVECFDASIDPVDYIEEATGYDVVAVPTGDAARFGDPEPFTVYFLATVYDNTGLTIPSMTYSTSNDAVCTIQHDFSNLGSWNNRIESFEAFNGCAVVFYDNPGFSTAIYGAASLSLNMGTANNRAESMSIG